MLILDEPTAVLTPAGGGRAVRRRCASCASRGRRSSSSATSWPRCWRSSDRITVLRAARRSATRPGGGRDRAELAELMVGRDGAAAGREGAGDTGRAAARGRRPGRHRRLDGPGGASRALSLEVRAGEIVGIAGVEGNGQSELVEALAGLLEPGRCGLGPSRWAEEVAGRSAHAGQLRRRHRSRPRGSPASRPGARLRPGGEPCSACSTGAPPRVGRCAAASAAGAAGARARRPVRRVRRPRR